MKNFIFSNPTKLLFGKDSITRITTVLPQDAVVLLTYGGGSIKKNGIYDQVLEQLKDFKVVTFGGIEANPDVATLEKAIALGREEKVNFILAVGGGSVIDGSKLIAAGIHTPTPAWEIVKTAKYTSCLPLGVVLTVPATGSEMNSCAVISNRETKEKFAFYSEFPVFSILDPTYAYTLSKHQIACGIADAFMHTCEQYLTYPNQSGVMDRMSEGILLNIIDIANNQEKLYEQDYDLFCEYMLSATIALNGFLAMGTAQDWLAHMIGHEITALTDVTHGASLAMVYPSVLRIMRPHKEAKIVQYAKRVWGIEGTDTDEIVNKAIAKTEGFFRSLGLAANMAEAGIDRSVADEIVRRMEERGYRYGEGRIASFNEAKLILEDSLAQK
ncbi:iron-containing alcohol dehydrogenase [Porphyromonas sp.]|uniref:iron-containing alcohol dehydrogenase n=1 Tax=Porphyromonas sp. TaxID=1924944 RepID=UPI0026DCEA1E|nr:iron-containing alcohol dehydrogenase [Porphyromonas sp.]MDO4695123.1 iron-containing alcohol dehydrogenase [Porphyromonas sp.]MDO4770232.1 iron-containing alcohol dehydrogenase [Porphyromonas sp.]